MRRITIITALLAAVLPLASCRDDEGELSFSLRAETVTEGDDLPVSLSLAGGPREGFTMACTVDAYDVRTGAATPTGATLWFGGRPAPADGVSFPDGGHRDFYVPGLSAGTYRVAVTLSRGPLSASASTVAVVREAGTGPGGGGGTAAGKKVTHLSVPGAADGFTVETEGGFGYVVLDLRYCGGRDVDWRCTVTPADADDRTLSASSDDGSVVTVSVTDGSLLHLRAAATGRAVVTVRSNDGGATASFGVRVVDTTPAPGPDEVADFTVPDLDPAYRKLPVRCGQTYEFTPAVTPAGADPGFTATSSDPSVVSVAVEGGTLSVVALYPGYASVTLSAANGPSKTFPVMVYKDVVVTTDWYELEASDAQLKRKCFPCKIRFSSDAGMDFPAPVTFTVSMKAVVTVAGQDTWSVSHKEDVSFRGRNPAYYDVTNNILIPAYSHYGVVDFGLAVSLSLQRNEALDPDIWRITWKDDYRTQEARIRQYLTDIQQ